MKRLLVSLICLWFSMSGVFALNIEPISPSTTDKQITVIRPQNVLLYSIGGNMSGWSPKKGALQIKAEKYLEPYPYDDDLLCFAIKQTEPYVFYLKEEGKVYTFIIENLNITVDVNSGRCKSGYLDFSFFLESVKLTTRATIVGHYNRHSKILTIYQFPQYPHSPWYFKTKIKDRDIRKSKIEPSSHSEI